MTRSEVANIIGISRSYLDLLCREERCPAVDKVAAIAELTRGEVDANYWAALKAIRRGRV